MSKNEIVMSDENCQAWYVERIDGSRLWYMSEEEALDRYNHYGFCKPPVYAQLSNRGKIKLAQRERKKQKAEERRLIMTEIEVICSDRLSVNGEKRYIVVDKETGEILDDAQGYGYKSKQKAYAAYAYKNRVYFVK